MKHILKSVHSELFFPFNISSHNLPEKIQLANSEIIESLKTIFSVVYL